MSEVWVKIYLPDIICWFFVRLLLFYRRIRYGFTFRKIPLTQGQFAIVDDDDFEKLSRYKWLVTKNRRTFYASRTVRLKDGSHKKVNIQMHRKVLNAPDGAIVDHINHNGLDNRKANLRLVTAGQNCWNARKRYGCTSKYKGVSWNKSARKWQARIAYKRKWTFIGYFDDELSAAKAYDVKARELFGDFAYLNFPDEK